ncbi:DEK domain-containing chromatin-associated protein 4-like [Pyrus communis]|uniref:DEK domain-containing chromatin-associated protein 4-like n=1 Tax=Pyrus communis TaxID=23211 RepID=UPI0035BF7432
MARERGTSAQPWGTLEELLLVCAVNRHGTQSWDSVALEVGSRCSPTATTLLSADNCRDKFADIKRRFVSEDDDDGSSGSLGAMVDELRRLRVEELRREVRRRDVSIVSLELKVKRLVEERERSLKEDAGANRPSKDLKRRGGDQRDGSRENLAGKMNSGEDFGSDFNSDERENRSFNESNSTSQRGDAKGNGAAEKLAEGEQEEEPRTDGNEPDPIRAKIRSEPDRDCSVNGKLADDDDEDNQNNNKKGGDDTAKASRLGKSSELWESGGESKREGKRGGGGAAASRQQNSDVQSSASLSKRKRHRGRGGEGGGGSRSRSRSSSGEEAEGDEVSPATSKGVKQLKLVKSEPLMKVLKIICSHRLGSVFERRLRSQESERYKSLIRQHMDLHVIQSKINKGLYTEDCIPFFRDLLLLFNNAVVFFRKNSPEHNAAQELRSIVLKEMNDQLPNPQPATGTVTSNVPKIETKAPKIEPDAFEKPTKSSIVVCGKRGSVNALSEGGAKSRKGDKVEEKAKAANEKKADGAASVKVEDKGIRRRRTQERGGRRGTSTRGRNAAKPTKPHEYGINELSSHDGLEALEAEKEKKENRRKKQGAARFLKRMKQNSPSTEVKKETSDGSEDDSEESEDEKKKKKPTMRSRKKPEVERNERVTRSSTGSGGGRGGGRRCQESNGRGRRGVGRPPKRPETAAAEAGRRKRGRENGEADQVGSTGRRRKRTRR